MSEAIKRAVANLVDNAAEAMRDAILKEITISTALVGSRDADTAAYKKGPSDSAARKRDNGHV